MPTREKERDDSSSKPKYYSIYKYRTHIPKLTQKIREKSLYDEHHDTEKSYDCEIRHKKKSDSFEKSKHRFYLEIREMEMCNSIEEDDNFLHVILYSVNAYLVYFFYKKINLIYKVFFLQ